MPAALSIDLRERIMYAYNSGVPVKEVAAQFYVGADAVYKLIQHVNRTGSVRPKPLNNGRKPKLNEEQHEKIRQTIQARPDITLAQMVKELELPVSVSALSKIINYKLKIQR